MPVLDTLARFRGGSPRYLKPRAILDHWLPFEVAGRCYNRGGSAVILWHRARSSIHSADKLEIQMEKPDARGPSPSRKAHHVLREKLNRKSKPPPPLPENSLRKFERAPRLRGS